MSDYDHLIAYTLLWDICGSGGAARPPPPVQEEVPPPAAPLLGSNSTPTITNTPSAALLVLGLHPLPFSCPMQSWTTGMHATKTILMILQ